MHHFDGSRRAAAATSGPRSSSASGSTHAARASRRHLHEAQLCAVRALAQEFRVEPDGVIGADVRSARSASAAVVVTMCCNERQCDDLYNPARHFLCRPRLAHAGPAAHDGARRACTRRSRCCARAAGRARVTVSLLVLTVLGVLRVNCGPELVLPPLPVPWLAAARRRNVLHPRLVRGAAARRGRPERFVQTATRMFGYPASVLAPLLIALAWADRAASSRNRRGSFRSCSSASCWSSGSSRRTATC